MVAGKLIRGSIKAIAPIIDKVVIQPSKDFNSKEYRPIKVSGGTFFRKFLRLFSRIKPINPLDKTTTIGNIILIIAFQSEKKVII